MGEKGIYEIISEVKNDRALLYEISLFFQPLLKKYASKLNYEDAYYDLQLALFEISLKIDTDKLKNPSDGAIINYIKKSTIHSYYDLAKKHTKYYSTNLFFGDEFEVKELEKLVFDDYSEIYKDMLLRCLTKFEYEIVVCHYFNGISIDEIAKSKKVSRQHINKCKISALKKLRQNL